MLFLMYLCRYSASHTLRNMSQPIVMRTFLKWKYNYQPAESTHNNAIVHCEEHVCKIKLLTSGVPALI